MIRGLFFLFLFRLGFPDQLHQRRPDPTPGEMTFAPTFALGACRALRVGVVGRGQTLSRATSRARLASPVLGTFPSQMR